MVGWPGRVAERSHLPKGTSSTVIGGGRAAGSDSESVVPDFPFRFLSRSVSLLFPKPVSGDVSVLYRIAVASAVPILHRCRCGTARLAAGLPAN